MNKYPQHTVTSRRTNNNNNLNTKASFCPKRKYSDCNEKYDSKSRFIAPSSSNIYGDAGNRVNPQDNRFDGRGEEQQEQQLKVYQFLEKQIRRGAVSYLRGSFTGKKEARIQRLRTGRVQGRGEGVR